ncbi:hypothetical protein FIBSPDRAFT_851477 [Athelia psychrophila]|uniref:Uncharacterized protein n=1 Tax=Athelia psychrophila TaxID=1759441 RepID=A0A166SIC6_9AGAM|nr:hypothetical protein FIBSPDRAFT_851471 [Fibularhizoctonia sp. CBS 109695]KZP29481.1 hypothetical protein FIBSPDRAFT_851477 [Fibularhizoctonia sp. CBS 109695]
MQFFKSTVFAALAFVAFAAAAPSEARECKPLLQSCSVDSECCSDGCLLGLCLVA